MMWTTDHRDWYRNVYLKSEHWDRLRRAKLFIDPECQRCGKPALDVHHIDYKNIFDVTLDDVESLCRPCHHKEHEENGQPKRVRDRYREYIPVPKKKNRIQRTVVKPFKKMTAYHLLNRKCVVCGKTVSPSECIFFAL